MLINSANLTNLYTGYKTSFSTGFRSVTPEWQKIATKVNSTTKSEQYGWLGQFPKLREWIGDRHIKSMSAHKYTLENKDFESTIEVDRNEIEDDTFGVYNPLFQEMGFAAAEHPDELVFGLIANGFAEQCYDGQYFFDTDHEVLVDGQSTSVGNMHAGSAAPWFLLDTRRPLKPLIFQERKAYNFEAMTDPKSDNVFNRKKYIYGVDARCNAGFGFWQQAFGSKVALDKAAFRDARKQMISLKSDEGRPLGIKPSLLVVGPTNGDAARDIILAEKNDGGGTNTDRNLVEILEVPWLA